MSAISIATYTVEVRAMRKNEPLLLKFEQGEGGASAYRTIFEELTTLEQCRDFVAEQHLLNVTKLKSDGTDIWGVVKRGEYGAAIQIYSAKTLEQTYLQKKNEAAMQPFYFRLHLPDGATKGILILQRTGIHGAYGDVRQALENAFRKKHEHHRVHFARAVHPEMLKHMLEGPIHAYKIVTYKASSDLTDFIKKKGPTKNIGKITISAEAKRGQSMWEVSAIPSWYKKIIEGEKTVSELWPEEHIKSFQLTMTYKGQLRKFDLTKPDDLFPYINVSTDVELGPDGHPDFDSIDDVCLGIRDDLREKLGLKEVTS